MHKFIFIVLFSALVFISCDKRICCENPPMEVTFNYLGKSVTYGIVQQDYTKDAQGNTLLSPTGLNWLDRNIGAERVATSANDSLAAGHLFQWGRSADGHQLRTSDTTQSLSLHFLANTDKFIASPLSSNDWLANPDTTLWNKPDNRNCPCPPGWRVPTQAELGMEMQSWSEKNIDGAYQSPLKWTTTGNRDNHGTLRYASTWAFMWATDPLPNGQARMLAIIGSDTSEVVTTPRIFGGGVRCVQDL